MLPLLLSLPQVLSLLNTRNIATDVPSVQLIHQESRHHWIDSAVIDGEQHIFVSIQSKSGLISEIVNVLKNIYGNIMNTSQQM